jgi:hypothetical protein
LKCSTIEEFNAHAEIVTALIRRGFHELSIDLRRRHETAICETYLGCIDWNAPCQRLLNAILNIFLHTNFATASLRPRIERPIRARNQ